MGEKRGLNANQIKLLAIFAMLVDHVTWTLWPGYDMHWWVILIHFIVRPGATVMWYFIAEGYYYTRDIRKYILRLFVFALLSHYPYTFALGIPVIPFSSGLFDQTGVIWALLCGLLMLVVADAPFPKWAKILLIIGLCGVALPADWSCVAALGILGIGRNRGNFRKQMMWMMLAILLYAVAFFFFADKVYAVIPLGTVFSIPLLKAYNGERGKAKWMKWLFYLFYPLHLLLIGLLRISL